MKKTCLLLLMLIPFYLYAQCLQGMKTNQDGFIRNWLVLEPIKKNIKSNAVFSDSYLRKEFSKFYFPNQMCSVPVAGNKERVDKQKLKWHNVNSDKFNVKLFRFASDLNKDVYGVMFWMATVVYCSDEIDNVRMAVGSNSASMWWLNGEEAVMLSGDRRMVKDDCVSKRLVLKKGRNVIKGAVLNGPGMSDFCLRFIDEDGNPIKGITIGTK